MTSAEGVSGTFPGSGRREVRELGVNYYCISFETPRATELGEHCFFPHNGSSSYFCIRKDGPSSRVPAGGLRWLAWLATHVISVLWQPSV